MMITSIANRTRQRKMNLFLFAKAKFAHVVNRYGFGLKPILHTSQLPRPEEPWQLNPVNYLTVKGFQLSVI